MKVEGARALLFAIDNDVFTSSSCRSVGVEMKSSVLPGESQLLFCGVKSNLFHEGASPRAQRYEHPEGTHRASIDRAGCRQCRVADPSRRATRRAHDDCCVH